MEYVELTATVAAADAERAAEALRALTGAGVWTEAPFSQPDLESDAVVDREAHVRVHAYARRGEAGQLAAAGALADAGVHATVGARRVAEEDWAEAWKQHFHVERFGRLVVVPSWRSHEAAPGEVVLTLDPGMAFGTGQHETTRMCLEALDRAVRPGAAVLDVGCGSGILSLAAAKLGASDVLPLDVDPDCVRVTRENARANGVDAVVRAAEGSLGDAWPLAEPPPDARFDLVVVNIIARVIVELAPALVAALRPGGRLIASGVVGERERETVGALTAARLHVESVRAMGEWRCIEAVR